MPSHGGGSAEALASDGLRAETIAATLVSVVREAMLEASDDAISSMMSRLGLRAQEDFPCFAAGSATNHRRDAVHGRISLLRCRVSHELSIIYNRLLFGGAKLSA